MPKLGPNGLPWSPLALRLFVLLHTIYTIDFNDVLGWFIQRWSRELTWIDDVVVPCPLYKAPYTPLPRAILKP